MSERKQAEKETHDGSKLDVDEFARTGERTYDLERYYNNLCGSSRLAQGKRKVGAGDRSSPADTLLATYHSFHEL
jgi:hypothetical protein